MDIFSTRETIAFIPVCGGSKSIPLKNIKPLCGKPLVYWVISALEKTNSISDRIKIGYSGHEEGYIPTLKAVALGMAMIERRFCLSRHSFVHHIECSLEPEEYAKLIYMILEAGSRDAFKEYLSALLLIAWNLKVKNSFLTNVNKLRKNEGLSPAPTAQFFGEDITQRRKGAEAQREEKGLLYIKIIVILQDSSCSTKIKRTTTPSSSPSRLCAFARENSKELPLTC